MGSKVLARCGRVAIRKFRHSDLQERLTWPPYKDPFFTHLNYSLENFIDRERWIFARTVNAGRMYFAVEGDEGGLIGEMSLREIDGTGKTSRLGIHLASDQIDKGYGGEALSALLEYYFGKMAYSVMYLDVAAWNFRALRLYERLQFEHLNPFWRRLTDFTLDEVPIFADERYGHIRRFFRGYEADVEALYYDMALTKERYYETIEDTKRAGRHKTGAHGE